MTVKARIVHCKKLGCAMKMPLGYVSRRGYCAECEHTEYMGSVAVISDLAVKIQKAKEILK